TVTLYLHDVPDPSQSLMQENFGLGYHYDSSFNKIDLYLPDSGYYIFEIGPTAPCIMSCFFPPDSIPDTFHFNDGTRRVLGHQLAIVQNGGWLNIAKGSKMVICEKAVLRNRDSLTLEGYSYTDTLRESYSLLKTYRDGENQLYRETFGFGSVDWSTIEADGRSMIIVNKDGALVLKDSSHTKIGCGATILVKKGGTLKIESGASVTIGGQCLGRNWGEIIAEDSSFVCIEPNSNIHFFESEYDTSDRHIFFISMNPIDPAHVGVGDSSNATPSAYCIDFCNLKDTFPEYGIGNHKYGWFNVGKPLAHFVADTLICDGNDLWIDGQPTLNESKFRFEICEYNKVSNICIGSMSVYPTNSLDNYYGGRIGKINLSDTANLLRGKTYKITLKVENNCSDLSSYTEIVDLPTELSANITADSVVCGGFGTVKAHGLNSTGSIDSVLWEVWKYVPLPEFDTAEFKNNADTFIVEYDTLWDSPGVIDTILANDTNWYNFNDTFHDDSFHFHEFYTEYFDTLLVNSQADTFKRDNYYYVPGQKYVIHLTLFNNCGISKDTLLIRTRPGPTVNAGPDRYMGAAHSSVTNDDPVLHGTVSGHTGSHTWSPTTQLSPSTSLYPTVWPSTTRDYVLSATDANGCTNYDTVTVWVNSFANAGSDTTICYDDSALIGIPTVSGYTYDWFHPSQVSDDEIAEPYGYPNQYADSVIIRLKVTDNSQNVEWDEMVIYRDTTIDPTFSQTPAGGPGSYA
ncbi:MAG: hypothetical protein KDC92_16705, partial [Bacteroidetes bacterium]|nr:hypothetical protein [Bacteroidota bacterium]